MRRLKRLEKGVVLLIFFISTVKSAAVPTEDSLVLTTSGDEVPVSTEAAPTTEGPLLPIKLSEMRVHSEIALRYARTAVTATVRNPAKKSQEAFFRVLLPETAFISGFIMTLDGKSYKAYVKEKDEAKKIYNQAVSQGIGAAHISAKARDSNHFTVSVNVEPNTTAVFNLTYEELLVRRNGVYNHAINLHPGALVPKMKVTVHIKESAKITTLRVPEVRTGNEVDATAEDAQNPNAAIDRGQKEDEATITFKPDIEEQKRLMQLYAAKTKESASHRPYYYGHEEDDEEKAKNAEGTIGQFVVQYDVDRSKNEQVLVNDGYFVHFLAPTSLPPLRKHVVFVLDTSGSMMGRKVEQLREAMQSILAKLNIGDYFSIVEFNSNVKVHDLQDADKPDIQKPSYLSYRAQDAVLIPPSPAIPENVQKAKVIISRLQAYGGTNINSALSVAIELIHKGVNWSAKVPTKTTTDKTTTEDAETTATTQDVAEDNSVSDKKDNRKDDLESIIIFLTDGDPTEGETNTVRILSHISEKNYGERKASIFSLAFGEDADRTFLRKLSLKNEGFMRHIYEAADAALQLRDFYQQVSSPLLANVEFTYPREQMKEGSLTRRKFRAIYEGSEVVVAGRVADGVELFEPHVYGFCGVEDGAGRKKYEISPKIPVSRGKNEYLPLERLWAYLTIKQLLDEKDASDSDVKGEDSPAKKALDIALKYEFVTPLTSLVVVKPNATDAINAESVDKPALSGAPVPSSLGFASFDSGHISANRLSYPSASYHWNSMASQHSAPMFEDYEEALFGPHTHSYSMGFYPHASSIVGYRKPSRPLYLHTKQVSSIVLPQSTTVLATTTISYLEEYHLEDYPWTKNILNHSNDTLDVSVNGQLLHLKLTKESTAPISKEGDAACEKSTEGSAGVCVYLTRCHSARNIDDNSYPEFAGVCCPKLEVDKVEN
ncbi:unnamed protein product [Leptidea sinapis]|uniref:Inter-alpha-trypsin inhibitor heavy chain H4-like n=1 Tax=Leptidea sinapis TaxID=189913 RepID=A0A5E4PPI9_9NEOP|nr:unnamed protein product [Leptidea sinapis]